VIIIEEVARACAASPLIAAVNKLGMVPLLLSGSEELKRTYLPPVAGVSPYYAVMAVTDPSRGACEISAFLVEKIDPGVSFGAPEKKLGIKGSPTSTVTLENTRIPADRIIGAEGTGSQSPSPPSTHPDHHRRPGARHRPRLDPPDLRVHHQI
jgi:alkylation response protein AidB-like acyl-CoA dehydrogenase